VGTRQNNITRHKHPSQKKSKRVGTENVHTQPINRSMGKNPTLFRREYNQPFKAVAKATAFAFYTISYQYYLNIVKTKK
jgi:hypothetical protein